MGNDATREIVTKKFEIYYHGTRRRNMRRGYHCPDCGKFYVEGTYTIESGEYVLGRPMYTFCCGEQPLSTPRAFDDELSVYRFLRSINDSKSPAKAVLIAKRSLIPALFNPDAIAKYHEGSGT